MANVLQFIIDFAARGGNAVTRQVSRLQGRLDAADSSASRLAKTVGTNLKTAFMSLPGAQFFTNPIVALSAGIGVVSKLGMEAQTTATSFEVLLGSQEKAVSMLAQLNAYAEKTPYDRLGAQNAAKTMLGFGVSAETVVEDLRMLGDVAGGDRNRLQQLALVFGQISAAGKLQGQDLLQLINAGYNPLLDIVELTGRDMESVRDAMGKGEIGIDLVRAAFERATSEGGRFNGMIDKLSESEAGKFGALQDTFTNTLLSLYEVIKPLVIPALEAATAVLQAFQSVVSVVAKPVQWLVGLFKDGNPFVYAFTAAIGAYTTAMIINTTVLKGWKIAELAQYGAMLLVEKAQWLINLAMSANPVGLVIAGIASLVAVVVTCWAKFAGFRAVILTTWDTIKGFAGVIKDLLISRITSLLQALGKVGETLSKLFKGDFSGAWDSAKEAASLFANTEGKRNAVAGFKSVIGGVGGTYRTILDRERQKQEAKDGISEPEAAAGVTANPLIATTGSGLGAGNSTKNLANDITAGGTRNTQITVNVAKFFDDFNVTAENGLNMSMSQLRSLVIESINRSLEIATSAAR